MLTVNLLPKKIEQERKKKRMQALMVLAGMLVVAVLVGLVVRLQVTVSGLERSIKKVKKQKESYQEEEKEITRLRAQRQELENRRQVVRGLLREQSEWLSALDVLTEVLPQNLWYDKLDGRKKGDELEIVLEGIALSDNEIFELTERLDRQKDFVEVELEDVRAKPSKIGYPGVAFKLRLKCKPELKELEGKLDLII